MALAHDLLTQSYALASIDATKPKQANLRRAVSTAYYALFHLLIAECVRKISPPRPVGLAPRIARALAHAEMRDVCVAVVRNSPGTIVHELLSPGPSQQLQRLAAAFVELQEERHRADYDLAAIYTRLEAGNLVEKAQSAFANWKRIQNTDEAGVFLSALIFAKRWSK